MKGVPQQRGRQEMPQRRRRRRNNSSRNMVTAALLIYSRDFSINFFSFFFLPIQRREKRIIWIDINKSMKESMSSDRSLPLDSGEWWALGKVLKKKNEKLLFPCVEH